MVFNILPTRNRTDQVKGGTVTAITANILSGDFDITQRQPGVSDSEVMESL